MNVILKLKPIKRLDLTGRSLHSNLAVLERYMKFLLDSVLGPPGSFFPLKTLNTPLP